MGAESVVRISLLEGVFLVDHGSRGFDGGDGRVFGFGGVGNQATGQQVAVGVHWFLVGFGFALGAVFVLLVADAVDTDAWNVVGYRVELVLEFWGRGGGDVLGLVEVVGGMSDDPVAVRVKFSHVGGGPNISGGWRLIGRNSGTSRGLLTPSCSRHRYGPSLVSTTRSPTFTSSASSIIAGAVRVRERVGGDRFFLVMVLHCIIHDFRRQTLRPFNVVGDQHFSVDDDFTVMGGNPLRCRVLSFGDKSGSLFFRVGFDGAAQGSGVHDVEDVAESLLRWRRLRVGWFPLHDQGAGSFDMAGERGGMGHLVHNIPFGERVGLGRRALGLGRIGAETGQKSCDGILRVGVSALEDVRASSHGSGGDGSGGTRTDTSR